MIRSGIDDSWQKDFFEDVVQLPDDEGGRLIFICCCPPQATAAGTIIPVMIRYQAGICNTGPAWAATFLPEGDVNQAGICKCTGPAQAAGMYLREGDAKDPKLKMHEEIFIRWNQYKMATNNVQVTLSHEKFMIPH